MAPPSPTSRVVVVDGASPPELSILSWPLRDEALPAVSILTIALALAIGAGLAAGSAIFALISAVALAAALRDLWIPVEFSFTELGVKQSMLGRSWRTPWREFSGYQLRTTGIVLLSDNDTSPLGLLRGIYIPCRAQRDALVAMVEHHLVGRHQEVNSGRVVRQPSE